MGAKLLVELAGAVAVVVDVMLADQVAVFFVGGGVAAADIAAQRTATLYSIVASAERLGLDPQRYLTGVLARIPSLPVSQLERLLPERWLPKSCRDNRL